MPAPATQTSPDGQRALAKHLQPRHPPPFRAPDQAKRGPSKKTWDISPCDHQYDKPAGHSAADTSQRTSPTSDTPRAKTL